MKLLMIKKSFFKNLHEKTFTACGAQLRELQPLVQYKKGKEGVCVNNNNKKPGIYKTFDLNLKTKQQSSECKAPIRNYISFK